MYYSQIGQNQRSSTLKLMPLSGGAPATVGVLPYIVVGRFSVSPDFAHLLYVRCDQCAADLMLVEHFR